MPNNHPFIWQPHCFVYNISVFFDDNRDNGDNILYGREDVVPVVMSLRDICSLSLVVNVVSVVVKDYCRKKYCRKEESSRLSLRSAYNNERCSSFTRLHLHSLYSSYDIRECQCVFFTSCMTAPVLSIIYRARVSLVTLMTEKPGAGEQNTVPVVGFTLREREAEELTT